MTKKGLINWTKRTSSGWLGPQPYPIPMFRLLLEFRFFEKIIFIFIFEAQKYFWPLKTCKKSHFWGGVIILKLFDPRHGFGDFQGGWCQKITLENAATEPCEGSKYGFLRVPSKTRPFPGEWHVYFMCLHNFFIFVTQRCVRSQSRGSWAAKHNYTNLDHYERLYIYIYQWSIYRYVAAAKLLAAKLLAFHAHYKDFRVADG